MRSNFAKIPFWFKLTTFSIRGKFRLLLGCRRSRKHWPNYDNAYLWHGEEAYEFNHSGSVDEYIDVLGTLMVLHVFHTTDFHSRIRRKIIIDRKTFKQATVKWWLRQVWRGRPNLKLNTTYYHFRRIHLLLIKNNLQNE